MAGMRIPQRSLQVDQTAGATPGYEAGRIVPLQDARGEQGEQFGRALQAAGGGLQRVGDFLQDQVDDAKSLTYKNEFAEELRKLKLEASQLTGMNAIDRLPEFHERIAKLREQFDERPENANQAKMFSAAADVWMADARGDLDQHFTNQVRVAKVGALAAKAEGRADEYPTVWQDPVRGPEAMADGIDAVRKRGAIEGWDAQAIKNAELDLTTKMHTPVVRSLTNTSPSAAAAYLAKHGGEIAPVVREQLEGALRESSTREAAALVLARPEIADKPLSGKIEAILADKALPIPVRNEALQSAAWLENLHRTAVMNERAELLRTGKDWVDNNRNVPLSQMDAEASAKLKAAGLLDDVQQYAANEVRTTDEGWNLLQSYMANPEQLRGRIWPEIEVAISGIMGQQQQNAVAALFENTTGAAATAARRAGKVDLNEELEKTAFHLELMELAGVAAKGTTDVKEVDPLAAQNFLRVLDREVQAAGRAKNGKLERDEIREMVGRWKSVEFGGKEAKINLIADGERGEAVLVHRGQRVKYSEAFSEGEVPPAVKQKVRDYNAAIAAAGGRGLLDEDDPVDAMRALAEERAEQEQINSQTQSREANERARTRLKQEDEFRRSQRRVNDIINGILREDQAQTEDEERLERARVNSTLNPESKPRVVLTGVKDEKSGEYNRRYRAVVEDFDRRGIREDDPERLRVLDAMYDAEMKRRKAGDATEILKGRK